MSKRTVGLTIIGLSAGIIVVAAIALSPSINQSSTDATAIPDSGFTLHQKAWYTQNASADTFSDLDNHPQEHFGDVIVWGCTVNKILGPNSYKASWTDVSCSVDAQMIGGAYSSAQPEVVLTLDPDTINVNAINPTDHLTISGYAAGSSSGTNAFGGSLTEPAIAVAYVDSAPVQGGQS